MKTEESIPSVEEVKMETYEQLKVRYQQLERRCNAYRKRLMELLPDNGERFEIKQSTPPKSTGLSLQECKGIEYLREKMLEKWNSIPCQHNGKDTKKNHYWSGFGDAIVAFDNALFDLNVQESQQQPQQTECNHDNSVWDAQGYTLYCRDCKVTIDEKQTGWIRLKDRLPEFGQDVWLSYEYGDQQYIDCEIWTEEVQRWYDMNGVTFWMPCDKPKSPNQ